MEQNNERKKKRRHPNISSQKKKLELLQSQYNASQQKGSVRTLTIVVPCHTGDSGDTTTAVAVAAATVIIGMVEGIKRLGVVGTTTIGGGSRHR